VIHGTGWVWPGGVQVALVVSRCMRAREAGPPPQENIATRVKRTKICQSNSIFVIILYVELWNWE
jgi:hypothetical protein